MFNRLIILLIVISFTVSSYGQNCNSSVPSYSIDLTGYPSGKDSVTASRNGNCCSDNNCILLNVTLDTDAAGLRMDLSGGTGNTYYKVGCSPSGGVLAGTIVCVNGTGPHEVTVCKPGGNAQTYVITSIPKPHIPEGTLYAKNGCQAILTAEGYKEDSIIWTAVDPANNSFLSCTSACDTTYVNINSSFPSYADFVVYGPASSSCLSGTFYDTVRVYYLDAHAGNDTTICASANFVDLNGSVEGATTGQWINGAGTFLPSDTALNATYIPSYAEVSAGYADLVIKTDSLEGCGPEYDTMRVTIRPAPAPTVTGSSIVCESDNSSLYSTQTVAGYTYQWTVLGGSINSGQGTSEISVDWGSAGAGFVYVEVTDLYGCEAVASLLPVVQYDFNHGNLVKATIGPDAISVDPNANSTGAGMTFYSNCVGSGTGLDLRIAGSQFNYGRLAMFFRYQRDENQAEFFKRGSFLLDISGGALRLTLRVKNAGGTVSTIGPLATGYTIPNDDQLRDYVLAYDSINGKVALYVDGSSVWNYNIGANNTLEWTSAGDAYIGTILDGACLKKPILDYFNVSVPVSIKVSPTPAISGNDTSVCPYTGPYSYQTSLNSGSTYSWSVSGGAISGSDTGNSVQVIWDSTGTGTLTVTETTVNGCAAGDTYNITILPKPLAVPITHD